MTKCCVDGSLLGFCIELRYLMRWRPEVCHLKEEKKLCQGRTDRTENWHVNLTFQVPCVGQLWQFFWCVFSLGYPNPHHCTMLLPMSISIVEILISKNSFLAHFWSKNNYFSSRWCRRAQILEWIFGFVYFVTYLQSYLQKTWRGGLGSMKFGV